MHSDDQALQLKALLMSTTLLQLIFNCAAAGNPAGAAQCDNSTSVMTGGICAQSCCAHCLKDPACAHANLRGDQCWLMHADPTKPFGKRVNSTGLVLIVPQHRG